MVAETIFVLKGSQPFGFEERVLIEDSAGKQFWIGRTKLKYNLSRKIFVIGA